ncbi:pyridoxamine 5'-phosphate oxidase [Bailinhaonella thermotolerans]|uniref:Pyridoxine/pyridoxamine 5'-phosphate oxidase n=1 Tax=Bailinhaonella thermotolerans TaxID=1070861 RepID=A0A3A4APN9_9ACTN|nr:pyridoxamine 5'-phosphate oxidase [Bailinhaonella thermotolerans]
MDLAALRRNYDAGGLDESGLAADPVKQFTSWLSDVLAAGLPEPNAMVLATATPEGRPSQRTVLLKDYGPAGFDFFTNYGSRKGRQLAANPWASLLFPWHPLHRQVIVEGRVERLSREESEDYFRSRPYGSRLGAWASRQSEVIPGRDVLEERYAELAGRWPDEVPAPDFWGGFRVVPETVEFWQGRPNRLHDRLRYRREGGAWTVERLSP